MGATDHGEEREYYSAEQGKEVELDLEPARNSLSSRPENHLAEENNNGKRVTRVPKKIVRKEITVTSRSPRVSRASTTKLQFNRSSTTNNLSAPKKLPKQLSVPNDNSIMRSLNSKRTETEVLEKAVPFATTEIETEVIDKVVPFATTEIETEVLDKAVPFATTDDAKEIVDVLDEAPNCDQSNSTDTETPDREEENVVPAEEKTTDIIYQKVGELEVKVEKLEDELREVAAVESSIYSVIAEHGSSGYEVHTPARRLSKIFIHACESFSRDKKDSMARSIVSGLVLVAKSCGNDVPRLTFWLSNTVVLREIIKQSLRELSQRSRSVKDMAANAEVPPLQWGNDSISKPDSKRTSIERTYTWHETSTFIIALKKIESWIFNRIVESVWWQALAPYMQSPMAKPHLPIPLVRLPGQYLGDRKQGNFSVNLWTVSFHDALTRLCPLRAAGSTCGCLPALAKLVMEHCVARLDIAIFNAILREAASEVPTDPISDPIADSTVLPIPPRDLSFGTGAQLRNAIGNWSISLTEKFGMDMKESRENVQDARRWFRLLHELSELLMLPKDMLLEAPIRQEVCPSFGPSLITRILCDFTPDEYSPDPVPSFVLDELNSKSVLDEASDQEQVSSLPCAAAATAYQPFTLADVALKVATAGEATSKLDKKISSGTMRDYTSEDDLKDLDLPVSFLDGGVTEMSQTNERYILLQEIWSE